jgi:hypothetical protein
VELVSASPTARTLQYARKKLGAQADVVEKRLPHTFTTKDVAGCIDVVAYGARVGILGIQTTSGKNHASRRKKALAEPKLRDWLRGGGQFEIWSWSKLSTGRWHLRRERVVDIEPAVEGGRLCVVPA